MKRIDHNYWIGYEGRDADNENPDLRKTMQQLYGSKGFDFGVICDIFHDEDRKNHYRPDGYSTYTDLSGGHYLSKHPFRHEAVKNNKELSERCWSLAGTIAGELFFPCREIDKKKTINVCRGSIFGLKDMVYPLLESIRRYYDKETEYYPLKDDIKRYAYFFDRFGSFGEYIEYNLLQDYELLPKRFPRNEKELVDFWKGSIEFLEARLRRIEEYAKKNDLFDSDD